MLELYLPLELLLVLSCVLCGVVSVAEIVEVCSCSANILLNLGPQLLVTEVAGPIRLFRDVQWVFTDEAIRKSELCLLSLLFVGSKDWFDDELVFPLLV